MKREPPPFTEDELTDQGFTTTLNGELVMRHNFYPRSVLHDHPFTEDTFASALANRKELQHPNLARILTGSYRVEGDRDSYSNVVVEHYSGNLLADSIRNQALGKTRLTQVMKDVGSATAYLHNHGWMHGDIDNERIVLTDDNRTILLGTESVDRIGTPQEQRMHPGLDHTRTHHRPYGVPPTTAEADVFALVMTALNAGDIYRPAAGYFLGTNAARYLDTSLESLVSEHTLPKATLEYLQHCISLSSERPQTGADFLTGLDRALSAAATTDGTDVPPNWNAIMETRNFSQRASELQYQSAINGVISFKKRLVPRDTFFPKDLATSPQKQEMLAYLLARVAVEHPTLMRMIEGESLESMTCAHVKKHAPTQNSNIWKQSVPAFTDLEAFGSYDTGVPAQTEPMKARVRLGDLASGAIYGALAGWAFSKKEPEVMVVAALTTAALRIGASVVAARTTRNNRLQELSCTEHIAMARDLDALFAPHLRRVRELLPTQSTRQYASTPILYG